VEKKTIKIPDDWSEQSQQLKPWAAVAGTEDGDLRDVSKPVAFDEHGRPLYAPRGLVTRLARGEV
jgi:hypothetical protein